MKEKYEMVPNIISTKDLSYLEDMYNWNFNVCKLVNDIVGSLEDENTINLLNRIKDMHKDHCDAIINILS